MIVTTSPLYFVFEFKPICIERARGLSAFSEESGCRQITSFKRYFNVDRTFWRYNDAVWTLKQRGVLVGYSTVSVTVYIKTSLCVIKIEKYFLKKLKPYQPHRLNLLEWIKKVTYAYEEVNMLFDGV